MLAGTTSNILGAVILISIVLPWFLIGVAFIFVLYVYAAAFYRASARELKVRHAVALSPSSLTFFAETWYSHISPAQS